MTHEGRKHSSFSFCALQKIELMLGAQRLMVRLGESQRLVEEAGKRRSLVLELGKGV